MTATPDDTDIENFYRLFLARVPEAGAAAPHRGFTADQLANRFVGSGEFAARIEQPLLAGGPVTVTPAVANDLAALARWAAELLVGDPANRALACASRNWHGLLAAVVGDAGFRRRLAPAAAGRMDRLGAALRERAADQLRLQIAGAVEVCDARGASGWAVNLVQRDETLTLEAYADGRFVAAGRTDKPRYDIREIYGGEGRFGFAIDFEPGAAPEGGPIAIEIRETLSRQCLGRRIVHGDLQPQLDAWVDVGRELAQIKAMLARIEGQIPDLRRLSSFSLASYGEYWTRFYAPLARATPAEIDGPRFSIIAVAEGDADDLMRFLASVRAQTYGNWALSLLAREVDAGEEVRATFDQARGAGGAMALRLFPDDTPASLMRNAAAKAAEGEILVFAGGGELAPEALAAMARTLECSPAAMIYTDGDTVARSGEVETHVAPRFLAGFDADLLAQTAYFGDLVAIRAEVFAQLGGYRRGFEAVQNHDLWLRAAEILDAERIVHIPQVLHHGLAGEARAAYPAAAEAQTIACVAEHLARIGRSARVSRREDILGAALPLAARHKPDNLAAASARVIIPTRDRFDLVEKCLASLERSRAANQCRFEILLVDNASDPLTGPPALEALKQRWGFATLEWDSAFNWAAINNAAARDCQAEVLVFLNNDTVVLTPDWCDSLVGLALRDDVGAVGARLLYEDGTLQHGGMVVVGEDQVLHEGAGTPGTDGGYLGRHGLTRQCAAVTGACMATRTAVFSALGGFDEARFAVTLNDVDYCRRARAAGLKVLYCPDATLYHLEGKTRGFDGAPEKLARVERERAAFRAKWRGTASADPFYNPHFERAAAPFTRLAPPPAV